MYTRMGLDRYQLLILVLCIPLTTFLGIADPTGFGINVRFAAALLWTGIGITLLLLSRNRKTRSP